MGNNPALVIDSARIEKGSLILRMAGGVGLRQPLRFRLKEATPEQLADWTLNADRSAVLWPRLGGEGVEIAACDAAWEMLCDQALGALQRLDWDMSALSDPAQREIVALWRLEADGYNGGFLQFFCNWGDKNCALALFALETIGATATLAIVRRQRAVLDRLEDHPELQSYGDIERLLTDEENALISDELDDALMDAMVEISPLSGAHYFDKLNL